jgi:small subunit ribosomal protein S1
VLFRSLRPLADDPWKSRVEKFAVGQLVEGSITRLTKFGAFARLSDDLEGLIHISEISEKRIEHPREVLHEGDSVTLRVIKIDPGNHRIGLSLRRVESMAYADMDWQSFVDEGGDAEKPAEKPAEEPAKAPAKKPAKKPAVKAVEEPTEELAEKPAEELVEAPVKKPAKKPAVKTVEEPVEKPAEESAEAPVKKPAKKAPAKKAADANE